MDDVAASLSAPDVRALPRRLGVGTLFLLIIAFNAPIAAMAGYVQLAVAFGNGLGAPAAFLISGAVLLLFAVGFLGMSRYVTNPGAFYRYIVDGMGKPAGLGGAFLAAVAYVLMMAGSYIYIGLIAADLNKRLTGGDSLSWQVWAVIFLVVITVLGLLRIDLSMKVLGALVCLEIVLVAIYEAVVLAVGGPEGYSATSWAPGTIFSGSVGLSVLFALITMVGIEAGAVLRDEVRDPDRNVPRATYSAIAFMGVLYAIGTWAYIITQGQSKAVEAAASDPVGSFLTSVETYLGNVFVTVVSIILVTSQLAACNAILSSASRYLYNLGRDRVLSRRLAFVHPRLQSPYIAVATVTGIGAVLLAAVVVSGVDPVVAVAAFAGTGTYFVLPLLMATSAAVVIFFRRHSELNPGPWVSLIAPVLAFLGLAALFVVVTLEMQYLIPNATVATITKVGLVVVAAVGILVALRYRKTRPEVYASIGNQ